MEAAPHKKFHPNGRWRFLTWQVNRANWLIFVVRRLGRGDPSDRTATSGRRSRLEIIIAALPARVWEALVSESAMWWPKEFHTSERAQRFVIEPVLGGRVYEDFGGGDGLVRNSVVGVDAGRELTLAGHLLPPFGGPAVTVLRLTLFIPPSSQSRMTE